MNKFLKILFIILIFSNFLLSSWYVLHQDINFSTDIGRDFLLLQELDQKKIALIGPRSGASGLFHGPLWMYLNYPAYVIGGGNPVVVGWWWIVLIALFTGGCFIIAKKLFNETTAYFFALMISTYMVFHSHTLFNPHGALFLLPFFFYFFIKYLQTQKVKYLLTHAFIGGLVIQFQMAVGVPFMMLSFAAILWRVISTKKYIHIFAYLLTVFSLSNFIIFDIRHQSLLSNSLLKYLSPGGPDPNATFFSLLLDRIKLMSSGIEIIRVDPGYRNLFLFIISLFFIAVQIKNNKYKMIYTSFIYFFIGFFLLSIINRGVILYFYLFPLFPLVFLIFSSFVTSKYSKIFILLFFIIYLINFKSIIVEIQDSKNIIGKDVVSWNFLYSMASQAYNGPEKEIGYFVYAPDGYAYAPKYAMYYAGKVASKKGYSFEKKSVTYITEEPPPRNNPYMQPEWWVKNKVRIDKKPESIKTFPNGYRIEKYILSEKDILIPIADGTDLGLHFR